MFCNKKIFLFILFLIAGCQSNKLNDSGINNGKFHRPIMNPGGIDFGKDPEFCKSYNKLQCVRKKECQKPIENCTLKSCNSCDNGETTNQVYDGELPKGAVLIDTQKIKKFKDDENWFNANCIENKELPADLQEVIESKCSKIIQEQKLQTTVLSCGKVITQADCLADNIEVMDYCDGPNLNCNKKTGCGKKKNIIAKIFKKRECVYSEETKVKKKKMFKVGFNDSNQVKMSS